MDDAGNLRGVRQERIGLLRSARLPKRLLQARFSRGEWDGAILGLVSLVLLVLLDLLYHRHAQLSATLVMAPILAAALSTPILVGAVGLIASGTSVALSLHDTSPSAAVVKMAVVVIGSVVAVLTARHRKILEGREIRLRAIAEAAESALLRPLPRRVGPASLAGWHVSATEEARVGGDFYEAVSYSTKARWIIGDARGHGVDAVRLGTATIGAFREAASRLGSLEEVAARVDESIAGYLGDEDFVTAIMAELSRDGSLSFITCGHHPPLRLTGTECSPMTVSRTRPLGIEPDLKADRLQIRPGESLLFFTDGLDEMRMPHGRRIDLAWLAAGLGDMPVADAASAIERRLAEQIGRKRFEDDVSVLVVKFEPLSELATPPGGSILRQEAAPGGTGPDGGEPLAAV